MTETHTRRATAAELAQAGHSLVSAILELGEAATDDAHRRYELPPAVDQRAWGAVTRRLLILGIIRRVGERHTRRAVAHGRRIGKYVAADPVRARQYLDRAARAAAPRKPAQRQLSLPDHTADPANSAAGPAV